MTKSTSRVSLIPSLADVDGRSSAAKRMKGIKADILGALDGRVLNPAEGFAVDQLAATALLVEQHLGHFLAGGPCGSNEYVRLTNSFSRIARSLGLLALVPEDADDGDDDDGEELEDFIATRAGADAGIHGGSDDGVVVEENPHQPLDFSRPPKRRK